MPKDGDTCVSWLNKSEKARTLAASHAAAWLSHGEHDDGTDRRTDGRQIVTSLFLLDGVMIIITNMDEAK